ncbi:hypothetical protein SAMN04487772_10795 [[Clostridium] polysaccharolyticum]|uniref:Uncharacterized protein n=1 Tax=[Clostridium] polysaccharolyticum TaxID=29364 RepID=A0A1I0BF84_9FIRM|nr:hypothetical protein SAMN04487772_10795 [[Clostridium] polysaccharolyticum]
MFQIAYKYENSKYIKKSKKDSTDFVLSFFKITNLVKKTKINRLDICENNSII